MEELQPEVPLHLEGRQLQAARPEVRDLPGGEAAVHQGADLIPAEAAESIAVMIEKHPFPTEEAGGIEEARGRITFGLPLPAWP